MPGRYHLYHPLPPTDAPCCEPLVFLHAVHYAVWLAWIPRALSPTAALAGAGVVIAAGCIDAHWVRGTYLALATFHIYLEIVVLAARVARRRR